MNRQDSILGWNLQNERDYSDDTESTDEEDPMPKWNIPNWKGNDPIKCTGCVKRVTNDGENRGCIECDMYWDMPDLIEDDSNSEQNDLLPNINSECVVSNNNEMDTIKPVVYCEGCDLLDKGLGGENQMSHSCLGY